jgi:uncharacterized membrane protein
MFKQLEQRFPELAPAAALAFTSTLSFVMLFVRWYYTGKIAFLFVLWNLFLAWIPLFCALLLRQTRGRCALVALLATWLVFLPNAPYVLTDMIHFRVRDVPYWYDLILLLTFAWTGTLAGYLSLFLVQSRVRDHFGEAWSWVFATITLGLTSFGIYLGRFLRFNSWEVVTNPTPLLHDIWSRMIDPFAHPRTYVFTALMGAFLIGVYATLYAFARMPRLNRQK